MKSRGKSLSGLVSLAVILPGANFDEYLLEPDSEYIGLVLR